jgi:hypothetical protein
MDTEELRMQLPHYYCAVFGDPKPPEKDEVESGVYHPNPKTGTFLTRPGDLLILYCTRGYAGREMEVPGIGVVLDQDDQAVRYRYLPLATPIPKAKIERAFVAADLEKFKNRRFSGFWLFEIASASFSATVDIPEIAWP